MFQISSSARTFKTHGCMMLLWALLLSVGFPAVSSAQKIIINEFYRNGSTLGATGTSWIEVVLTQSMTAAELNTYHVGDSNNGLTTRNGAYRFNNMGSISANFAAGTIIVVSGGAGITASTSYNPGGGDYNIVLRTNGANITRVSGGDTTIAGSDVIWVDTTSTGNTLSANGFAVAYGGTGSFEANASLTLAAAPGNNRAAALTGNTNVAGAYTAGNWSTNITAGGITPGTPNNATNTTWINGMRTSPDTTAPTVLSSNRQTPASALTNAGSVTFRVTFSENLNAATVSTADFTLTDVGGSIAGESVTSVAQGATANIWDVTVDTGTGNGTLRLDVAASATLFDQNGLALTAAFNTGQTYTTDTVAPTVSSSVRVDATPTNAASVQFTVTLSEDVTGFANSNFSLTTTGVVGASVASVSGSGTVYTVTVNTGTGSGTIRLNVANSTGVTDSAGNTIGNVAYTGGQTYTIDKDGPDVVSITRLGTNPTNNATVTYLVLFNQTVSSLTTSNFGLTTTGLSGSSVASVSADSGFLFTVTVNTGSGAGTLRLDLANSTGLGDDAGNPVANAPFTTGAVYNVDRVAPTVTVSGPASPTNGSPITFTLTFSEIVTGLTAGEVTVTGGTKGALSGSGTTYTIPVTPTGQGAVTCLVTAGAAQDATGNTNTVSNNLSITYDSVVPTVVSSNRQSPGATNTNTASVTFRVIFSEGLDSATVSAADFTPIVVSGTLSGPSVTGINAVNALTYDVTVNPGSGNGVLRLNVVVPGATIGDPAGNALAAGFTTGQTYNIDVQAPTITLSSGVAAQTNAAFTVSATISESVSNFIAGDVTATNASVSGFSGSGAGPYTWTVTPTAQGPVTVQVLSGTCTDPATNPNTDSNTITTNYDSIAPTVTQQTPDIGETINDLMSITLLFSDPVTGVAAGALQVNGSAAIAVSGTGTGPYVFSGFADPADGTVNVALNGAAIVDAAGNAVGAFNYSFTKQPAVITTTITSAAVANGASTNASPLAFSVAFTRAVSNFVLGDITVTNGTPGGFAGSGANYTFNVTPTGQGLVSVQIAAAVATGTAVPQNPNAAANPYEFTYDSVQPSVTLTPGVTGVTNSPFNITVAFSESTTNFVAGDLTVTNATISNFTGSTDTYSFTVNPTAQGNVSVSVGAGSASDIAGNLNTASNTVNVVFDSVEPTVTLTSTASDPTNTNPIPFVATFSEDVTAFTSGKVSVIGGTITAFTRVNFALYTFNVIPASPNVLVTVDVGPAKAQDAAGNQNQAAAAAVSRQYDSVAPNAVVSGPASPTNAGPINFTITFDEAVTGLTEAGISVTGGTPGVLSGTGPYTLPVTPDGQGTVTCQLDAAAAQDAAGNACPASNALAIDYDSVAPTPVVSGPASPTNTSPIEFTIQFDEPVSGLSESGLTITGGTAAVLQGTGAGPYTIDVTPTGEGAVTCQVQAGAASDGANASTASNVASVVYDSIAPEVLSITRQAPLGENTNAASVTYRVTFSEAVNDNLVGPNDFTVNLISGNLSGSAVTGVLAVNATTFDVAVNPGLGDGVIRLEIVTPGATITDLAGSGLAASFLTGETYTIDTSAPSGVLNSTIGAHANGPFTVLATFNEAITGLSEASISATNATVSNLTGSDAGPYTFLVTPGSQGPVSVQIGAGACTDLAGNALGNTNFINTNHDSLAPAVTQSIPNAGGIVLSLTGVTLSFSEAVTGVTTATLTVNGEAAAFVSGTGAGPYSFSGFTPPADGIVTIALDGTAIADQAGNVVGLVSWNIIQDINAVQVDLTSAAVNSGGTTNQASVPVIVTFSQPVSGFAAGDITAAGATISGFAGSDANYSFNLAPTGEGFVQVQIAEGVCITVAAPNNPNVASDAFNFTYDATAPGVTLQASIPAVINAPFNVNVAFQEPVSDFTDADVSLTNATVSNFTGLGASYSFTVNPSVPQGTITVDVLAGAAHDAAGNPNTAGNTITIDVDSVPPTVVSLSVIDAHTVDVTFSEALTAGAANVLNFTLSGSGKGTLDATPASVTEVSPGVYRLSWNAGQMRKDGDITITVGGVFDLANNLIDLPNAATALNAGIGQGPVLTIFPVVPNLRGTPVPRVEFFFSADVTGFDVDDLTLTRDGNPVSLAGLSITQLGASVYIMDLTPVTGVDGVYTLGVIPNATSIKDLAGNLLADVEPILWAKGPYTAAQPSWAAYE